MAPRKEITKRKRKAKKSADPLFRRIKADIVAARNKLRVESMKPSSEEVAIHRRYLKLKVAYRALGLGPLRNIIPH